MATCRCPVAIHVVKESKTAHRPVASEPFPPWKAPLEAERAQRLPLAAVQRMTCGRAWAAARRPGQLLLSRRCQWARGAALAS
ncbi:hypothetical protein H8959_009068 [Pygathrix nigripes]